MGCCLFNNKRLGRKHPFSLAPADAHGVNNDQGLRQSASERFVSQEATQHVFDERNCGALRNCENNDSVTFGRRIGAHIGEIEIGAEQHEPVCVGVRGQHFIGRGSMADVTDVDALLPELMKHRGHRTGQAGID